MAGKGYIDTEENPGEGIRTVLPRSCSFRFERGPKRAETTSRSLSRTQDWDDIVGAFSSACQF
jgi:hypothetical protein